MSEILCDSRQDMVANAIIHAATMHYQSLSQAGCAPHALMRPRVMLDGNAWCALYGDNLQEGVAGFGDSPATACAAFDAAWHKVIA